LEATIVRQLWEPLTCGAKREAWAAAGSQLGNASEQQQQLGLIAARSAAGHDGVQDALVVVSRYVNPCKERVWL